jgi:hypothetical protein
MQALDDQARTLTQARVGNSGRRYLLILVAERGINLLP